MSNQNAKSGKNNTAKKKKKRRKRHDIIKPMLDDVEEMQ